MNVKAVFFGLFSAISGFAYGGGPVLNVVNTTEGTLKNNSTIIDFNIGELMVTNINSYTTGFLQPQKLAGPLAVSNFNQENETYSFSVYPNPTSSYIYWDLAGNEVKKVVIFGITGNKVIETLSAESKLNVEDLSPGIYHVELYADGNKVVKKFKIVKN
ncbi:MAG: T9SS type A sorting domain-containing protein [Opitutaceae bacterium]|nr:T9SS type A sorting domain-containing protein [Cytophagales bacterium]